VKKHIIDAMGQAENRVGILHIGGEKYRIRFVQFQYDDFWFDDVVIEVCEKDMLAPERKSDGT